MRKLGFLFVFLIGLLFYGSASSQVFALGGGPSQCSDVGGICGANGLSNITCCNPDSKGKAQHCDTTQKKCVEDVTSGPGATCVDTAGSTCNLSDKQCCSPNSKGQTLYCDTTTQKCTASTCSNEGQSCAFVTDCCTQDPTTKDFLECTGFGPNQKGTCTKKTTITPDPNTLITPPPPPCASAISASGGCTGVNTALGLLGTDPQSLVKTLFGILLSLSGGIAVLLIMFSGYRMMMSQGDPEKLAGAREQLTAAIIGLLFLIFSLVILQVIGVDMLHLPGFSGGNTTTHGVTNVTSQNVNDPGLDATACQKIKANPQCGFTSGGTGLFCGQAGSATNCGIQGNVGTLYKCDSSGNMISFQRCPNQDCITAIGAPNADYCGSGAIKHYSCQSNGLCQEDPNGQYSTGNCDNACS